MSIPTARGNLLPKKASAHLCTSHIWTHAAQSKGAAQAAAAPVVAQVARGRHKPRSQRSPARLMSTQAKADTAATAAASDACTQRPR